MDGDASLEGVHNHVPLEDALRAVTHEVKVEAVASEFVQLSTILGSGVSDVHHAVPCCIPISLGHYLGVQPLTSGKEVIVVPSDDHRPLHVDHLCSHFIPSSTYSLKASQVVEVQGWRDGYLLSLHFHYCVPCGSINGGWIIPKVSEGSTCGCQADSVSNPPIHNRWIILQTEYIGTCECRLRKHRKGFHKRPAMDFNSCRAMSYKVPLSCNRINKLHARALLDVDCGSEHHWCFSCAHLEHASILHLDTTSSQLQVIGIDIPYQCACHGELANVYT
mmetsp:Transcript_130990/g.318264  ORF Transcript_130990/g.318264 Transcript_130990/m.318264 type:complete len:277 (+) Transcript_130990:2501-3331(+)